MMIVFVGGFHMRREREGDRLFDALNTVSRLLEHFETEAVSPSGCHRGQCQAARARARGRGRVRARKQRPLGGAGV